VDLTINQGEFVLLEGENFSGKSTIIDLILGIRDPDNDDAEVKLFGYLPNSIEARLLTGVVFQEQIELPSWTQVGQFMNLIESHYPNSKGKVKSVLEKSSIIVNDEFIKKRTNDRT
ncbi:MAG: ATP-binding cassette domain-containing protein, partial [bacterium]